MDDIKRLVKQLMETHAGRGDPAGWFDEIYARSGGDIAKVHWADLVPSPHLVDWLTTNPQIAGRRAVVVGCGLGDDAEALTTSGYEVTAFDISSTAIEMCRARYPQSRSEYQVVDLFDHPAAWTRGFDLVFECNTIQTLEGDLRTRALEAIAGLVAPEGVALVSCRSRETGEKQGEFPLPLDREEIGGFRNAGLVEEHFEVYDDDQDPPVPHFFAVYRRSQSSRVGFGSWSPGPDS